MNATFADIHAAADYIGPGAIEVPLYQTEIFDICHRSSAFGQRIKQVPATGHPSRFFEETAIPNPGTSGFVNPRSIVAPVVSPTRVERSVPLKAIVSQINYNLFDVELGEQQKQFAYLQAKDLVDTVSGLMVAHDVALWNGNDTSLSSPTTTQYMGVIAQIVAGGNTTTIGTTASIVDGIKSAVAQMVANNGYSCASDCNLREPGTAGSDRSRDEDRVQRGAEHRLHHRRSPGEDAVDASRRSAFDSRLEPWLHGHAGFGNCSVACLHRDRGSDRVPLAWRSDSSHLPTGLPGSLTYQYVAVKFGAPVVKGANYAHYQVLVDR